ncbi:MAG TPA: CHAT domain-containing protein [Syntrophobacteraceae bacterium]|nr:CHAT domain-containing protein [Syntrophobacteraceae bacterium]
MGVFRGRTTRFSDRARIKCFLLGAVGIFILAAGQDSLGAGNLTFDVGMNQIGEACRVVPSLEGPNAPGVQAAWDVICGKWEGPSAKIFVVKGGTPARDLATLGWWRNRLASFASCGQPVSTGILDGVQAVALDCKLRPGGWPYQALAASLDNHGYLAYGIPASYPVVERAIGVLSGKVARSRATEQGVPSAELKRLEPTLANAKYSAGDLKAYRDLLWRGQYYNFQGNYAEAEKRYDRAMELERKLAPGGIGNQCFVSMHIALELSNQEHFNLAEATFKQAQSLVQKSAEPDVEEARLTGYRAIHMANLGKKKEALDLARKATMLRRELARQYGYMGPAGPGSAQVSSVEQTESMKAGAANAPSERTEAVFGDLVQSLTLEAAMLIDLKELDKAGGVLREADKVINEESRLPKRWMCQVMLLQARIAELGGNWQRAESLLVSAIDIQRSLYIDSRNEGLALAELGRVYAAQGRTDKALEAFRKGFDIVNRAQWPISIDEASPFFHVSLLEAKAHPDRRDKIFGNMFEVAQMARGSVVAESMAMTVARLSAGNDAAGAAIRDLQDSLYARDKAREALTLAQADPKTLSVQIDELEKKYADLNNKIEGLEREVQVAAPTYNQVLDRKVPARDVIAVLRPNEALSVILLGKEGSFVFFVDPDGIAVYETDLTESRAAELVNKMRQAVEPADKLLTFPAADAYTLYEKLFGSVRDRLAKAQHLIYVPSGPLLSLPFGVLVVERPGNFTRTYYSEVEWMALHKALTLAPSVQSFANLRTTVRPPVAQSPFIGFGDFVPLREDPGKFLKALNMPDSCMDEADLFVKGTWNKLPYSATELREVSAELGAPQGSLVMGDSFTAEQVEKTKLDNYKVVYFSTHGLLPSKLKCFTEPALVVSKGTGLLNASDVARLKMNAELVVLSACDSGGPSGQTGGQSLSGLARSFFYAGARSMIVSHWELLDKPSVELLTTMFKDLAAENISFAEALKKGQTVLIKEPGTSHPMVWGALCLVGDGGERLSGEKVAKK